MKEVILLTGVIGSGKDYTANLYEKEGYERVSFAQGVRELTWTIFDWNPKTDEDYDKFKSSTISIQEYSHSLKGRDILINIGNGFRNILGEDIWIDMAIRKIEKSKNEKFVISDCRYPNEVLKISEKYETKLIFCNYKSERYQILNSPSELMAQKILQKCYQHLDKIPLDLIKLL